MSRKPSSKSRKILKIALSLLIIVILFGGIFLGIDYSKYKYGKRSHFFGTLNTYEQNQTLRIGSIDLKFTSVKTTQYDGRILLEKEKKCLAEQDPIFSISALLNSLCRKYAPENETDALNYAKNYKQIEIGFSYNNISDKPVKFSTQNYDLLLNTPKYNYFRECNYQWSENLIKGSPQTSCIRADIAKSYNGPLNLEITLNGVSKRIVITKY